MTAYYNEIDPYAAQWLRNLITAGHIAPGDVDERSIEDVSPDDIRKYKQCHFFAGVGAWSVALRRAGWDDDQRVWTGSCPCQPFSTAGQGAGFTDERHLWPAFYHLITQCEPERIFGEQVASKDGLNWLDLVQTDLEGAGYANAAVDLCSAGVGAPNIRQRLWFVAERLDNSDSQRLERHPGDGSNAGWETTDRSIAETSLSLRVADAESNDERRIRKGGAGQPGENRGCCTIGWMADTTGERRDGFENTAGQTGRCGIENSSSGDAAGPTNGIWADVDWLLCRDDKFRPVEPGTFPLANGVTNRVGRLRAYGNAINVEAAKTFIEDYMSCEK